MEMDEPRRNLLELAGRQGSSLAQLSRMIGKNSSYLQQFVRKGSPRKLEETDRATLARFFGVAEATLGAPKDKSYNWTAPRLEPDWIDVPRLALDASAGPGAAADEELVVGTLRFSARWLREQGLEPSALSAIAVQGDSMEPTLRDGDEILVDSRRRPLRDGIHVVRLGDALLVKRLETARFGRIALLSDNPAYRPIECDVSEVEIIGRVVWKGGRI
ncbi:S24 family peptidase [Novosphingobium album (ex Liu et al. 2023)]|uniref:S24 family peptidase n=1 Tax=Novosphingobium album (ex Liu et al. 2023) TaxID=3031130 RepID=A0ABT5WW95_9SPHN|nr:LexA family transcriptional regulator [Novosphingobium album (ex Liu et al. 2023)]MDE8654119.1 S24 family peptidase [Novosphingobium album (ex Liu et al. 2023)]